MLRHIDLGFFKVSSYSLMMAIGLLAFAIYVVITFEKVERVSYSTTNRLLAASAVGFVVMGASAWAMNTLFHSIEAGAFTPGGITWLGGVLGAFPFTIWLIHKMCPTVKGAAIDYFNLLIPGITIAHGFGRVGCFLGGCCYGGPTDSIFGVSFPEGTSAARLYPSETGIGSAPVLPTQLFEAVFELLLFLAMILLYKRLKKHFLETYCFAYGTFRFIMEFFRGDDRGDTGFGLTPSQFMSLALFVGATLLILYHKGIIFKKLSEKCKAWRAESEKRETVASGKYAKMLRELKALADDGVITEAEFERKKKEILSNVK